MLPFQNSSSKKVLKKTNKRKVIEVDNKEQL
jgi:hypothetical protein